MFGCVRNDSKTYTQETTWLTIHAKISKRVSDTDENAIA